MAGETQEPFNLSLLENSIHSGSVSFGRFEKETLSWEKRSSFSHNRYLEEAEKFTKPGSVNEMRAHFEAHFKKRGIRFPSPIEAQTWGHQPCTEKDANLWESASHCSLYSYDELEKLDQEKSQYGDSCVSYDDEFSSVSAALEKTEIGCSEMTLEDKETTSSSAAKSKPLKTVQKDFNHAVARKEHVVMPKRSPSCNTKTTIDTKRKKETKPKRIVKSIASKAPTAKKPESLTPLATNKYRSNNCIDSATRDRRTTTNGFNFRRNERAEKRKEEKVEPVVCKALNSKVKPIPKITQLRSRHTSIGQAKARDDAPEKSSKSGCDQSVANGTAKIKSKLNVNKQKPEIQRSLNGLLPKSSDQFRNNANRRTLAVRRSAVEVAL